MLLRNARVWRGGETAPLDVRIEGDRVAGVESAGRSTPTAPAIDLEGRLLLPGMVNAHDHLDFSTFPPLGRPPYASVYEWAAAVDGGAGAPGARDALAVPLADRLFLGGLRNLLSGVTAVVHHNPYHRSLGRRHFPVRVLARYGFAHSPGLTPRLRATYRTTDRRIPWLVHAAEGTDERCRAELDRLAEAGVLRQNTVIVHGISLPPEAAPRIAAAKAAVVWCPESNRHLYGATAPVGALQAAGVRIGLGSDSPVSGVRDALSNLRAARAEAVFDDVQLLDLATRRSAEVARLPVGGATPGSPADFVAVSSLGDFLAGRRAAVALVVVAGRAIYGEVELLRALPLATAGVEVDGSPRRIESGLARRAASLLRARAGLAAVPWISGLRFD
jgi:cytosine/adenosine deaminase-related metal-dependent hydrolase